MDCQQVLEMLDAYALGALSAEEEKAVEEHIAGCVACWEELGQAERAAGLIALTAPMRVAPERLGQRIISTAQREARPRVAAGSSIGRFFQERRIAWPAAAGVFATATAAVLVFAVSLQLQVDDLQGDRGDLEAQVATTEATFANILQVATADDVQETPMEPTDRASTGTAPEAEYIWSRTEGMGVIFCSNLPALGEDEVYQAWYAAEPEPVSAGTFEPQDGECHHLMIPVISIRDALGVGITREREPGSARPSRWLVFASFD